MRELVRLDARVINVPRTSDEGSIISLPLTGMSLSPRAPDEALLGESPNIIGYCPNCGEPVTKRKGRGRQKIFCSKKCRDHYAYRHPNYETWTGIEERVCEYCGKTYTNFRRNSQHRKYCSLSCSGKAEMERRRNNGLGDQKAAQGTD